MEIARLDSQCDYRKFLEEHLLPNMPCLLPPSVVETWPCFKSFIDDSDINYALLVSLQGSSTLAPVHRPSTQDELDEGCAPTVCDDRPLGEVITLWKEGRGEGLYVKDWHLALTVEKAGEEAFYEDTWAGLARDDWLNGFYRSKGEDFRFVYLGAAGTTTLLHRDVYSSNSISTNVLGRKRWHLFPPEAVPFLHRDPTDLRSECVRDVRDVAEEKFSRRKEARVQCIVVEQEEGETIFVPSGWYHQVENLPSPTTPSRPVLSINHNWANSTTLLRMYDSLCADVDACARSIEDVRLMLVAARGGEGWEQEWAQSVQDLVKLDAGWHWLDFWSFVQFGVQTAQKDKMTPWQPPRPYIYAQVGEVLQRMEERPELCWMEDVQATMRRVREELSLVNADDT